ncbi:MAG: hypothetical protein ACI9DH_001273 [Halioglobus sp.]|jgi:hypothetical protein
MKDQNQMTRRNAIKAGGAALATLIIARSVEADDHILSPTNPMAMALGYYEDADEVDAKKWAKKAGPGGDQQLCSNCSLYSSVDDIHGNCSIFPGKQVAGAGWCNAWMGG